MFVGYDVFGRNNFTSFNSPKQEFNAKAARPWVGAWDAANNQVTYDSSTKYTNSKTPLQASTATHNNTSERGKARRPSSGTWTGTNACYVTANSYSGSTPGWELHIWLAPNNYGTQDCDIVIPAFAGNVGVTQVNYKAVADAIYAGNIKDTTVSYQNPQNVLCSAQTPAWRGKVQKDAYGNCSCMSGTTKLKGGDKYFCCSGSNKELSVPAGEIWCVGNTSCKSKQHKEVNVVTWEYDCYEKYGCLDTANENYDSKASAMSSVTCKNTNPSINPCKSGYTNQIPALDPSGVNVRGWSVGNGYCMKILDNYHDILFLVYTPYLNKWNLVADKGTTKGWSGTYTTLSEAQSAFNELKKEYGCKDTGAKNYSEDAKYSGVPCEFEGGCTDSTADNYDEDATQDDGSCTYTTNCSTDAECPTGQVCIQGVCSVVNGDDFDWDSSMPYIVAGVLGLALVIGLSR